MTEKEVIDKLNAGFELSKSTKTLVDQIKELEELSTTIKSIEISDKVQTSHSNSSAFEKIIFKKSEKEEELIEAINENQQIMDEVESIIKKVKDLDKREVLYFRHMKFLSFGKIAKKLYISKSSAYSKYNKAIKELMNKL